MSGQDYVEVQGLTVDFDGFKANQDVDVTFLQGRIHFLIGPNGAGKTTLVDALTGLVQGTGYARYGTKDLLSLEGSGAFQGVYHVLQGRISPLEGMGPEKLTLDALVDQERSTYARLRQVEPCPDALPRRPGLPERRPLF